MVVGKTWRNGWQGIQELKYNFQCNRRNDRSKEDRRSCQLASRNKKNGSGGVTYLLPNHGTGRNDPKKPSHEHPDRQRI